jgi:cytidine deaminase
MPDDAPPADLLAEAWRVHANAYVPYSHFPVGAALRCDDGRVFAGANVENASYGLGRCAEQSAVLAMASAGGRRLVELVVVSSASDPASPCGACRQVLYEFGPDARVWLVNEAGEVRRTDVGALLPDAFSLHPDASTGPA